MHPLVPWAALLAAGGLFYLFYDKIMAFVRH
jgi:hypothetical protein